MGGHLTTPGVRQAAETVRKEGSNPSPSPAFLDLRRWWNRHGNNTGIQYELSISLDMEVDTLRLVLPLARSLIGEGKVKDSPCDVEMGIVTLRNLF